MEMNFKDLTPRRVVGRLWPHYCKIQIPFIPHCFVDNLYQKPMTFPEISLVTSEVYIIFSKGFYLTDFMELLIVL